MKHVAKELSLLLLFAFIAVQQVEAAPASSKTAAKSDSVNLSGKVLETMDGGGYTYVLLQTGATKTWAALPLSKVSVGQKLSLIPGFEMRNFASKGLNRRFDSIIFSAGMANSEKVALSQSAMKMVHQGVPNAPDAKGERAKQPQPAKTAGKSVKIAKAKGANSYTVAEIFAKRGGLQKKQVVVRGRVTRVAERIMKKNWVHIEDGSGSRSNKTSQVVVTTRQLPKEGDVVTATGTLYNNLDFGSGYRYEVLIQDAKLKR